MWKEEDTIFVKPFFDEIIQNIGNYGKGWNSEEHTEYTGDGAADRDCKNNPQRAQPRAFTENLWSEIKSVKLLENNNQNGKDQGIFKTYKEQ